MTDELSVWAEEWKSMEIASLGIVRAHRSAHGLETAVFSVMGVVCGVLALAAVAALDIAIRSGGQPVAVLTASLVSLSALVLAFSMRVWRSQIVHDEASLTDSPRSVVRDLIAVRLRELFWWSDRRALAVAVFLAALQLTWAIYLCVAHLAWGSIALLVLLLVYDACLVPVGVLRTRFLRRHVASLREIEAQLEGPDDLREG